MPRKTTASQRVRSSAVGFAAIGLALALLVTAVTSPCLPVAAAAAGSADLDAATREALALEDTIERAEEDATALRERIDATNASILRQETTLAQAHGDLQEAQRRFDERVVRTYKSGVGSPLLVLVSAESATQLWSGMVLLSRVIEEDTAAYREAQTASAEADYQASVLDELKTQLVTLRELQDRRLSELQSALEQQRRLVATLSAAAQKIVAERKATAVRSRKEWRASSIPFGTPIPFEPAVIEPYKDRTYLVAMYQPKRYRTTGERFVAVTSWYGGVFNGRGTASGQIYNMDDLTCASRTLPFGTRIALTLGDKRVIVVVNDRGPYVDGRNLDLSRGARRALGFWGVAKIDAEFVEPVP